MPTFTMTKNWDDGQVLTESMLDDIKTSVETFLNTTKIDSDNIQTGGIVNASIANSTLTVSKINVAAAAANSTIVSDGSAASWAVQVPPGTIFDYAGSSAPTGFLECDGSSVLRATYASLFTAIGTTWGSVDGTHFTLPDLRRRVTVGKGGSGSATLANSVGSTGGEETHTLTAGESGTTAHTHTASQASHTHLARTGGNGADNQGNTGSWSTNNNGSYFNTQTMTSQTPAITVDAHAGASASSAHNIMQPSAVCMKIIKI